MERQSTELKRLATGQPAYGHNGLTSTLELAKFPNFSVTAGVLASLIGALPNMAAAAEGEHDLQLKVHGVYWADEGTGNPTAATPNPKKVSYEQGALGLELNYKSPWWGDVVGVDVSGYEVLKLSDSGTPTTQLVEVGNNAHLQDGYTSIGQALIKLKWHDLAQVKVGRQLHDSVLLKSTYNRANPDTYSGISAALTPLTGVKFYGAVYNRYRSRTTGTFEPFRTEANGDNTIKYISILGASYVNKPFELTAEYLNSKSYLSKFALLGGYTLPVQGGSLKLSGGVLTSKDAGPLFVCGAEKDMDCSGTSRIANDGTGVFVDAAWKISNFTLGADVAKFSGFWIEDNFAVNAIKVGALTQDPGTNPFPTSATVGPDFTNKDELATSVRFAYDWKDFIPGLKSALKYVRGTGAHSSNKTNAAEGREYYRELDARYDLPFVKNVGIRYMYLNYSSRIDGFSTVATINGMTRQKWSQHRFYIDYSYQF